MFAKILLVASLVVAATSAPSHDHNWNLFKQRFNKTYDTVQQEQARRFTWQQNLKHINDHNERYNLGQETFTLAMNQFGDLSSAEFAAMYNGYRQSDRDSSQQVFTTDGFQDIPATVDWRTKGVVTPIKDQGQCGSCWAFSAVASLEGQHAIKDNALVSLSEQNLVDCSGPEGNEGCGGGLMDQAFDYIKKNNGIDTEASYPYQAQDEKCRFKTNSVGATLSSWTDVAAGDETALATAIANIGPISVAIDASQTSFQFYHSGVYYEKSCSSTFLDHGVTAVGYGTQDGTDYYWVKNSWGTTWGNQGYIQMSRNKSNNCGIATAASYPNV